MAQKTKIYISARVIAPPASGGAFQLTASLANAIVSNPVQTCLVGTTNRNVTEFQKLLLPSVEWRLLVAESGKNLHESEEGLIQGLLPDWAFFPYPRVDDIFPDSSLLRPADIAMSVGCPEKANRQLKWNASVNLIP